MLPEASNRTSLEKESTPSNRQRYRNIPEPLISATATFVDSNHYGNTTQEMTRQASKNFHDQSSWSAFLDPFDRSNPSSHSSFHPTQVFRQPDFKPAPTKNFTDFLISEDSPKSEKRTSNPYLMDKQEEDVNNNSDSPLNSKPVFKTHPIPTKLRVLDSEPNSQAASFDSRMSISKSNLSLSVPENYNSPQSSNMSELTPKTQLDVMIPIFRRNSSISYPSNKLQDSDFAIKSSTNVHLDYASPSFDKSQSLYNNLANQSPPIRSPNSLVRFPLKPSKSLYDKSSSRPSPLDRPFVKRHNTYSSSLSSDKNGLGQPSKPNHRSKRVTLDEIKFSELKPDHRTSSEHTNFIENYTSSDLGLAPKQNLDLGIRLGADSVQPNGKHPLSNYKPPPLQRRSSSYSHDNSRDYSNTTPKAINFDYQSFDCKSEFNQSRRSSHYSLDYNKMLETLDESAQTQNDSSAFCSNFKDTDLVSESLKYSCSAPCFHQIVNSKINQDQNQNPHNLPPNNTFNFYSLESSSGYPSNYYSRIDESQNFDLTKSAIDERRPNGNINRISTPSFYVQILTAARLTNIIRRIQNFSGDPSEHILKLIQNLTFWCKDIYLKNKTLRNNRINSESYNLSNNTNARQFATLNLPCSDSNIISANQNITKVSPKRDEPNRFGNNSHSQVLNADLRKYISWSLKIHKSSKLKIKSIFLESLPKLPTYQNRKDSGKDLFRQQEQHLFAESLDYNTITNPAFQSFSFSNTNSNTNYLGSRNEEIGHTPDVMRNPFLSNNYDFSNSPHLNNLMSSSATNKVSKYENTTPKYIIDDPLFLIEHSLAEPNSLSKIVNRENSTDFNAEKTKNWIESLVYLKKDQLYRDKHLSSVASSLSDSEIDKICFNIKIKRFFSAKDHRLPQLVCNTTRNSSLFSLLDLQPKRHSSMFEKTESLSKPSLYSTASTSLKIGAPKFSPYPESSGSYPGKSFKDNSIANSYSTNANYGPAPSKYTSVPTYYGADFADKTKKTEHTRSQGLMAPLLSCKPKQLEDLSAINLATGALKASKPDRYTPSSNKSSPITASISKNQNPKANCDFCAPEPGNYIQAVLEMRRIIRSRLKSAKNESELELLFIVNELSDFVERGLKYINDECWSDVEGTPPNSQDNGDLAVVTNTTNTSAWNSESEFATPNLISSQSKRAGVVGKPRAPPLPYGTDASESAMSNAETQSKSGSIKNGKKKRFLTSKLKSSRYGPNDFTKDSSGPSRASSGEKALSQNSHSSNLKNYSFNTPRATNSQKTKTHLTQLRELHSKLGVVLTPKNNSKLMSLSKKEFSSPSKLGGSLTPGEPSKSRNIFPSGYIYDPNQQSLPGYFSTFDYSQFEKHDSFSPKEAMQDQPSAGPSQGMEYSEKPRHNNSDQPANEKFDDSQDLLKHTPSNRMTNSLLNLYTQDSQKFSSFGPSEPSGVLSLKTLVDKFKSTHSESAEAPANLESSTLSYGSSQNSSNSALQTLLNDEYQKKPAYIPKYFSDPLSTSSDADVSGKSINIPKVDKTAAESKEPIYVRRKSFSSAETQKKPFNSTKGSLNLSNSNSNSNFFDSEAHLTNSNSPSFLRGNKQVSTSNIGVSSATKPPLGNVSEQSELIDAKSSKSTSKTAFKKYKRRSRYSRLSDWTKRSVSSLSQDSKHFFDNVDDFSSPTLFKRSSTDNHGSISSTSLLKSGNLPQQINSNEPKPGPRSDNKLDLMQSTDCGEDASLYKFSYASGVQSSKSRPLSVIGMPLIAEDVYHSTPFLEAVMELVNVIWKVLDAPVEALLNLNSVRRNHKRQITSNNLNPLTDSNHLFNSDDENEDSFSNISYLSTSSYEDKSTLTNSWVGELKKLGDLWHKSDSNNDFVYLNHEDIGLKSIMNGQAYAHNLSNNCIWPCRGLFLRALLAINSLNKIVSWWFALKSEVGNEIWDIAEHIEEVAQKAQTYSTNNITSTANDPNSPVLKNKHTYSTLLFKNINKDDPASFSDVIKSEDSFDMSTSRYSTQAYHNDSISEILSLNDAKPLIADRSNETWAEPAPKLKASSTATSMKSLLIDSHADVDSGVQARNPSIGASTADANEVSSPDSLRALHPTTRAVLDKGASMLLEMSLEGIIRYISPAWQRITGTDPSMLVDEPMDVIMDAKNKELCMLATEQLLNDQTRTVETHFYLSYNLDSALGIKLGESEGFVNQAVVNREKLFVEAKGMLMYDRHFNQPSHVLWVLQKEFENFEMNDSESIANNSLYLGNPGNNNTNQCSGVYSDKLWHNKDNLNSKFESDITNAENGSPIFNLGGSIDDNSVQLHQTLRELDLPGANSASVLIFNNLTVDNKNNRQHDVFEPASSPLLPIVCRICDKEINPIFFEQHAWLCAQSNRAAVQIELQNDELSHLVEMLSLWYPGCDFEKLEEFLHDEEQNEEFRLLSSAFRDLASKTLEIKNISHAKPETSESQGNFVVEKGAFEYLTDSRILRMSQLHSIILKACELAQSLDVSDLQLENNEADTNQEIKHSQLSINVDSGFQQMGLLSEESDSNLIKNSFSGLEMLSLPETTNFTPIKQSLSESSKTPVFSVQVVADNENQPKPFSGALVSQRWLQLTELAYNLSIFTRKSSVEYGETGNDNTKELGLDSAILKISQSLESTISKKLQSLDNLQFCLVHSMKLEHNWWPAQDTSEAESSDSADSEHSISDSNDLQSFDIQAETSVGNTQPRSTSPKTNLLDFSFQSGPARNMSVDSEATHEASKLPHVSLKNSDSEPKGLNGLKQLPVIKESQSSPKTSFPAYKNDLQETRVVFKGSAEAADSDLVCNKPRLDELSKVKIVGLGTRFDKSEASLPTQNPENLVDKPSPTELPKPQPRKPSRSSSMIVHGNKGLITPTMPSIDDFQLLKPISKGAYGSVYLAKKRSTGEYFAIKILKKSDMIAKNQIGNIKAERMIMIAQNDSPFVVKLLYTFQSQNYLYLVMEYLNGGDCASLLKSLGSLPEDWTRSYLAEVALGLENLHNLNIVHRDVKPDNLLIDQHGHLKLTDFGLSRLGFLGRREKSGIHYKNFDNSKEAIPGNNDSNKTENSDKLTQGSSASLNSDKKTNNSAGKDNKETKKGIVGTPDYLAPESILGTQIGEAVDWWALGIMCYEFLLGIPPFHDDTPEAVFENILTKEVDFYDNERNDELAEIEILRQQVDENDRPLYSPEDLEPSIPDISPEARDLILKLLEKNPENRLGTKGPEEVKSHPFFKGVSWDDILKLQPAFVPDVQDIEDTNYFDTRGATIDPLLLSENNPLMTKNLKKRSKTSSQVLADPQFPPPIATSFSSNERLQTSHTPQTASSSLLSKSTNSENKLNNLANPNVSTEEQKEDEIQRILPEEPLKTFDHTNDGRNQLPTDSSQQVKEGSIQESADLEKKDGGCGDYHNGVKSDTSTQSQQFGGFSFKNLPALEQENYKEILKLRRRSNALDPDLLTKRYSGVSLDETFSTSPSNSLNNSAYQMGSTYSNLSTQSNPGKVVEFPDIDFHNSARYLGSPEFNSMIRSERLAPVSDLNLGNSALNSGLPETKFTGFGGRLHRSLTVESSTKRNRNIVLGLNNDSASTLNGENNRNNSLRTPASLDYDSPSRSNNNCGSTYRSYHSTLSSPQITNLAGKNRNDPSPYPQAHPYINLKSSSSKKEDTKKPLFLPSTQNVNDGNLNTPSPSFSNSSFLYDNSNDIDLSLKTKQVNQRFSGNSFTSPLKTATPGDTNLSKFCDPINEVISLASGSFYLPYGHSRNPSSSSTDSLPLYHSYGESSRFKIPEMNRLAIDSETSSNSNKLVAKNDLSLPELSLKLQKLPTDFVNKGSNSEKVGYPGTTASKKDSKPTTFLHDIDVSELSITKPTKNNSDNAYSKASNRKTSNKGVSLLEVVTTRQLINERFTEANNGSLRINKIQPGSNDNKATPGPLESSSSSEVSAKMVSSAPTSFDNNTSTMHKHQRGSSADTSCENQANKDIALAARPNELAKNCRPIALIVDDNPVLCKIIEVLLRRYHIDSVIVRNGAEAVRCAMARTKFDLIFMDLNMPILDGDQAARVIKSTNNANSLSPIIGISAFEGESRYVSTGVLDFKPVPASNSKNAKLSLASTDNSANGFGAFDGEIVKPITQQKLHRHLKNYGLID